MSSVLAKLRKMKDGADNFFPVTHADAVQMGPNMNLTQKLAHVRQGYSTYVVDLEKWGITAGIPTKPYVRMDYLKADANVKGINDALKYAYDLGCTEVIMPRNEYALCFPREIIMQDGVILNGNGSRGKYIYDSVNKSPFDRSIFTEKAFKFAGQGIVFTDGIRNSHLINFNIEGDKYDRAFTDPEERAIEWSTGVSFTKSASYNSVKHCRISGFMGDNVNVVSGSIKDIAHGVPVLGDFDAAGAVISATTSLITPAVDIPEGITTVTMGNLGYDYITGLATKEIDYVFYKEDGTFIGKYSKIKVFTNVTIPIGSKRVRVKFYDETNPAKNTWTIYKFGGLPMFNEIKNNEIFFGFRGGIQPGGSHTLIENNILRNNGVIEWQTFIDGKPTFSDPTTRYAINQEDSYGDHTVVRNNLIHGGYHGVLIRTWYALVEKNVFYDMSGMHVVLYNIEASKVSKNYFHSGTSITMIGTNHENAHVQIDGNTFINSKLTVPETAYKTSVKNNFFTDTRISVGGGEFKGNTLKVTGKRVVDYSTNYLIADEIEDCIFYTDGVERSYFLDVQRVKNSKFTKLAVLPNLETGDSLTTFTDCSFEDGQIYVRANLLNKTRAALLKRCELKNTWLRESYSSNGNAKSSLVLDDCDISIATQSFLFSSETNGTDRRIDLKIKKSRIKLSNPAMLNLVTVQFPSVVTQYDIELKDTTITYTGANPLNLAYFTADNVVASAILANVTLTNIAMSALPVSSKYKLYDPDTQAITEPVAGYYPVGRFTPHGLPTAGGIMGWFTIVGGYATAIARANTTAYAVGAIVYAGTNVYQCTVAGTSGTTVPTHTTGTAVDGTVTWQYMSPRAVFKSAGAIAT